MVSVVAVAGRWAAKLTNWENHRTRSEVVDATIRKNFLFQFVNNYFVLFYIAYIRPYADDALDELLVVENIGVGSDAGDVAVALSSPESAKPKSVLVRLRCPTFYNGT